MCHLMLQFATAAFPGDFTVFVSIKVKERKIHKYLENRRIFAYDSALAAATLLDALFGVKSLKQGEFTNAVSQINELAELNLLPILEG